MKIGDITVAEGEEIRLIALYGMDTSRDSKNEYLEEYWNAEVIATGEKLKYRAYYLLYDPKGPKERKV